MKPIKNKSYVTPRGQSVERRRLEAAVRELQAKVGAYRREIESLKRLAGTDPLTQVANRRAFDDELSRRLVELNRLGRGFCLILLDIDNLKPINDQHGHLIGDQLLKTVTAVLRKHVRGSDLIARIGGDEFAIVMPGTKTQQAKTVAVRILEQAIPEIQEQMPEIHIGFSIGIVQARENLDVSQLMDMADKAMYAAKRQGGNQVATNP